MIDIKNITLKYPHEVKGELEVLQNFSLHIKKGEVVSLIGPSGCGKTSLLNLLAGLIVSNSGTIIVNGLPANCAQDKKSVSYVLQKPVLFPWRNILQNVLLPSEVKKSNKSSSTQWNDKALKLLSLMGLDGFEQSYPEQLSGGMQARASLARAYLLSPKVLLMDEPFASLDQITRDKMNVELLKIKQTYSTTIFFVTHSIEEAVFLSNRVVLMAPLPSRIEHIFNIDLPLERPLSLRDTQEFISYTKILREKLEVNGNG